MSELQGVSPPLLQPARLEAPAAGFAQGLLLRARVNRAFYVALAGYALFAAIGLKAGFMHGDILVRAGIYFILVMGLDLLFGLAGMLSFAHIGFFSVAAYSVGVLSVNYGVGVWLAALAGAVLNIAASFVIGRICLRLSGSYFILGTLAFGLMVHSVVVVAYPITGGDGGLGGIPRPEIAGVVLASDLQFGAMVWTIAAVLLWYTLALANSRAGRALKAMRSDPVAAASLGIDEARLRTSAFVVSAAFASIAGALYAMYFGALHPDSFHLGALLDVLLMLFLGGYGSIWGGLVGATFITALPELNDLLRAGKELFDGILFALIILAFPRGFAGLLQQIVGRLPGHDAATRRHPCDPAQSVENAASVEEQLARVRTAGPLVVHELVKRFGGVVAVDRLHFVVTPGTVKGLIGPNGAGKSTTVGLIAGMLAPDGGSITLGNVPLTGLRPDQIARLGVMRTFQHERMLSDLDVVENVMVGVAGGLHGSFRDLWLSATGVRRWAADEREGRRIARVWLDALGLGAHAGDAVDTLPTGLRKLVEVARACAALPAVLLLDETAAGLNESERVSFREFVLRLRQAGIAIVLIEHDLDLVMALSDEVCVLDFGQKIADASPQQVRRDEQVIAAYMGA